MSEETEEITGVWYGKRVRWTDFNGNQNEISVDFCPTPDDARQRARDMALKSGWAPPRWWQWWRWNDTRL